MSTTGETGRTMGRTTGETGGMRYAARRIVRQAAVASTGVAP
ncbi:hypothetical protein AB0L47_01505 [Streptomyces bobili]